MANGTAQQVLKAVQWKVVFSQAPRWGMISKTRNTHGPSQAVLLEGLPKSLLTPRRVYTPARSWALCLPGQLRAANYSKGLMDISGYRKVLPSQPLLSFSGTAAKVLLPLQLSSFTSIRTTLPAAIKDSGWDTAGTSYFSCSYIFSLWCP